jgi:hypothetical protein
MNHHGLHALFMAHRAAQSADIVMEKIAEFDGPHAHAYAAAVVAGSRRQWGGLYLTVANPDAPLDAEGRVELHVPKQIAPLVREAIRRTNRGGSVRARLCGP